MFQQDIKDIKMDRSNYANNFQLFLIMYFLRCRKKAEKPLKQVGSSNSS